MKTYTTVRISLSFGTVIRTFNKRSEYDLDIAGVSKSYGWRIDDYGDVAVIISPEIAKLMKE